MGKSKILFILIAGCLLSFSAQAKLYKWVDSKGETHYGETIPSEYADRNRSEMDKTGRIVNTKDILTPEERRAKDAEDAKSRAAQETERDQRLHDSSLLNTYSNVNEIDSARKRNVDLVDIRIKEASKRLEDAKNSQAEVQQAADARSKTGKPVPPFIQDELQAANDKVEKLTSDLARVNAEKAALEARFESDKVRYRALTGKQ